MKVTRQKNEHHNRKRVRIRPGYILAFCFMFAVFGSSGWQIWKLNTQIQSKMAQLNQEKSSLIQQQNDLQQEIKKLNTPSYIEQLAREQLGLVKHGEILISPKK